MKQALSAIIIAAIGTLTLVQAQQTPPVGKCSLTLAQAPEIRSLRLGMTSEDVLKKFPSGADDHQVKSALSSADKEFGRAKFSISGLDMSRPEYEGVTAFYFEFLDNRLVGLSVSYKSPEWKTLDDFIARLSEAFKLPPASAWDNLNSTNSKTLTCQGFKISAAAGSWVSLRTLDADQIVNHRHEEAKEKVRKAFKP